ncbi:DUF1801 domain-containing protein [Rathayibacter sp. YIM 133350]|uniref:iron chaperone n=1 Tax=Rathayibacter sp. YIM 133350 TaxID=3131992 RepID=UPI00307E0251
MGTVDDYLATLEPRVGALFGRIRDRVYVLVPEVVQGTSYAMPAYLYHGKGLLATMQAAKHLALYPYSGQVLTALGPDLDEFSHTQGTLRFSLEHPPSDALVDRIIQLRRAEIDEKLAAAERP